MKRPLSIAILLFALILGIAGDLLVREVHPGLGLFLWISGLVLAFVLLQHIAKANLVKEWKWMGGAAVAMGGAFLWRASGGLLFFAFIGTGAACVLMSLRGAKSSLAECGLLEYCHGALVNGAHAAAGLPMLIFSDLRPEEATSKTGSHRTAEVVRGLAIALPVLFVIGSLFVGADAVFQNMVYSVFDLDLAWLVGHLLFTAFVGWVVAGVLRGTFVAKPTLFPYAQTKPLSLGITEVTIILGSSILLFVLFLAVQFRYLFGGAGLVLVTPSLTYAEYARRGFFELTAVVALVLPMLLALEWMHRKESASHLRLFKVLAVSQVFLLFAVIASALQRMLLYQREYGLTEMRLYTTAFMGWMGFLLLWYVVTVLSGRRSRFAIGAVAAAYLTVLVLLVMNPDDFIARTNIERSMEGKEMDAKYLASLSNDAVPALVNGFQRLDEKSRIVVAGNLLKRKERIGARDWRSWSWSSFMALQALEAHEEELKSAVASRQ
jgi:hypothetical protein